MPMELGYTLMTEQSAPQDLVSYAVRAEELGFDFAVSSDHYFPWIDEMGHSPNAWVTLGAVAHATSRIPFMTYVTCPTIRYRPAVVAQQAATLGVLSGGRFTLGLGAGENLNEHVIGQGWPPVAVRHEMFAEAVQIIKELVGTDDYVTLHGDYFDVDGARLWDRPADGVPIGIAVSGKDSCELAGEYADMMIAVEPEAELGEMFAAAGGAGKPRVGQLPISYGADRDAAVKRAHELFRWFGLGWKVMADLPGTAGFDAATQFVREDDVAEGIPCGDDVDAVLEAAKEYADAGFTHLALVQIGNDQQEPFFQWAESTLMPAWRDAFGS